MINVADLKCPGCGERWAPNMKECPFCHKPIVFTSFNNVGAFSVLELKKYTENYKEILSAGEDKEAERSLAICLIKLNLYDKALAVLEKSLEENFSDADAYFLASICMLGGKKPFLADRDTIDKIINYINAGIEIDGKGIYHCFLAYVKYDYFERKFYSSTPNYKECLLNARQIGYSEEDVSSLFGLLKTEKPEIF